jgi:hypothetical protein
VVLCADHRYSRHQILVHRTLEPNLLHWTRDSLIILWPTVMQDRRLVTFIIFILQTSLPLAGPLPILRGFFFFGILIIAVFFILLDYRYGKHRHRQEPSSYAKKIIFISTASISIVVLTLANFISNQFPFLDTILLLAVLSPVWWVTAPRIYHSRRRVLVSRGL